MQLENCFFCTDLQILAIIIAILHILECVGQTVGLVIFLPRQFDFGIVEISGAIVYLMIKACLTILSVGMGIVWFALFSSGSKSFTEEHEEMAMNMMTGVAIVLILKIIVDVYFWKCVFNFYLKLKSKTVSSNA